LGTDEKPSEAILSIFLHVQRHFAEQPINIFGKQGVGNLVEILVTEFKRGSFVFKPEGIGKTAIAYSTKRFLV
jgi:hypothetical protein